MAELRDIPILSLLPQRPPFVMVDALVAYDGDAAETEFDIKPDNIFVRAGKFMEAGLVENVAQTCAARIGYINKILNNESVKLGIIGAVRNFAVNFLPSAGDVLRTRVEVRSEVFAMTLVEAVVKCGDRVVASCEMKISVTDIESETDE